MEYTEIEAQLSEFKQLLPVDILDLGGECVKQPGLYTQIGDFAMQIKRIARIKKNHADFISAKIKRDIRNNPGNHGVAKLSVDAVDEACTVNKEYQEALKDSVEYQYLADSALVFKESVESRKSLIRDAVNLHTSEYYMTSKDTGSIKALGAVSEDQVQKHRQELASKRAEDQQEQTHE